ncbi:hypothetical protein Tco_1515950 [Tanacetum coccineum]
MEREREKDEMMMRMELRLGWEWGWKRDCVDGGRVIVVRDERIGEGDSEARVAHFVHDLCGIDAGLRSVPDGVRDVFVKRSGGLVEVEVGDARKCSRFDYGDDLIESNVLEGWENFGDGCGTCFSEFTLSDEIVGARMGISSSFGFVLRAMGGSIGEIVECDEAFTVERGLRSARVSDCDSGGGGVRMRAWGASERINIGIGFHELDCRTLNFFGNLVYRRVRDLEKSIERTVELGVEYCRRGREWMIDRTITEMDEFDRVMEDSRIGCDHWAYGVALRKFFGRQRREAMMSTMIEIYDDYVDIAEMDHSVMRILMVRVSVPDLRGLRGKENGDEVDWSRILNALGRFKLYSEEGLSDEDDKDDNQRIDWVDNYIAIRNKRDGQV